MAASVRDGTPPAPLAARERLALFRAGIGSLKAILAARLWRRGVGARSDRVAVLVTRSDIEPANHGAAVKIQQVAAAMSRRLDAVFVVTDDRASYMEWRQGKMRRRRFPTWLRWLAQPRKWVILRLLLRGFPVSNLFLYYPLADASYARRALWLGRRHGVVLWQAEFPAYARACLAAREVFGGATVLAEHNVEYERIREQSSSLGDSQYTLLRYWELRYCRASDHVVCCSERDRETLVSDGVPGERVTVIPHGVDLAAFREAEPVDVRERFGLPADCRVLVYHGTYRYAPNLEAVLYLAHEILPRLGSGYRVLAVGLHPPRSAPAPEVVFTGPVEDLPGVLKGADLALVPLQQGGGTRMKVLDYFAAGIPVISTSKGVEGLDLEPGREYLGAGSAEAFVDAIRALEGDPGRRDSLVRAGAAFVEGLDWQAIGDRYLALVEPGRKRESRVVRPGGAR